MEKGAESVIHALKLLEEQGQGKGRVGSTEVDTQKARAAVHTVGIEDQADLEEKVAGVFIDLTQDKLVEHLVLVLNEFILLSESSDDSQAIIGFS